MVQMINKCVPYDRRREKLVNHKIQKEEEE